MLSIQPDSYNYVTTGKLFNISKSHENYEEFRGLQ